MATKSKPFIAARVPEGLNKALEKHVDATGESRTAAIINALSSYLKWSDTDKGKPISAGDRLSKLEDKIAELEKLLKKDKKKKEPEQLVIGQDNNIDNSRSKAVDNTDNIDTKGDWMTTKEAHSLYGKEYNYESFRKFKPERLKEQFGLEVERIAKVTKKGSKKTEIRFRRLPD